MHKDIESLINTLPIKRQAVMKELRQVIVSHLPEGFEEIIDGDMISYVVPHSKYPLGYHCDRKKPLPFISIASQKNYIALYHMGLYANKKLLEWFTLAYSEHCSYKLNMGKSCVRFKYMNDIPYSLIAELSTQLTTEDWITMYEAQFK